MFRSALRSSGRQLIASVQQSATAALCTRRMNVKLVGHRGFGASDSPFHVQRDERMGIERIPEGTLASLRKALETCAEGVEMDAIETGDGNVVGTHADDVRQHILVNYDPPERFIGRMTVDQIKEIPVGPGGKGRIALLKEILMLMSEFPDKIINIELKGKLFNFEDDSRTQPSLAKKILDIIEDVKYPMENVIFSSFAESYLHDICQLCRNRSKLPQIGLLFEPYAECVAFPGKIFKDRDDQHQPLSVETLQALVERMPMLTNVHAEIREFSPDVVAFIRAHNLKLVSWALRELSPLDDIEEAKEFAEAIDQLLSRAQEAGVAEVTIITDHLEDVKKYLATRHGIHIK